MLAKRLLSTTIILQLSLTNVSYAQSPLEIIRDNAEATKSAVEEARQIGTQNRDEIERLRSLIEALLSQNEAARRADQYKPENRGPDAAKADAVEMGEKADAAADNLTNPDKQADLDRALGEDLRKRMAECATGMKSRWESLLQKEGGAQISEIEAAIQECSPDDVRTMLEELKEQQRRALDAWGQCRDVLVSTGKVDTSSIPLNPSGLARGETTEDFKKRLEQIKQDVEGLEESARNCGSNLTDLFEQIQNQEDSAAAMATMMNFAASACMGSGGNPWVCGSLFAIALLMSLFSDGGGDGDGDGESDGTGQKGNGQNVGGTGPQTTPPGNVPDGTCDPTTEECGDEVVTTQDVIPGDCDPNDANCAECRQDGTTAMICSLSGKEARFDVTALADSDGVATTEATLSSEQSEALAILKSVIARTSDAKLTVCGPITTARGDLASGGLVLENDNQFFLFPTVQDGEKLLLQVEQERSPTGPAIDKCPSP